MDEFCAKTSVGGSSERATFQAHVYKHLHVCVLCARVCVHVASVFVFLLQVSMDRFLQI